MRPADRVAVKVCGITSQAFADMAVGRGRDRGADVVGFIFHPPSPRNVLPEDVAAIRTPDHVLRAGIFVRQDAQGVQRIMREARLDLAQLAGNQDEAFCEAVGPHRVMRVFRPERHAEADDPMASLATEMDRFKDRVRFALLDAGTSGGGHGRSLDFSALAALEPPAPWWLAGGLGPDNLALALAACSPFGVDLNSGVESAPGVKDETKLALAFQALGH